MAKVRVGISGWTFPAWRGTFYPKGLPQKKELEFASQTLSSIEINGTFYSLQRPDTFRRWYEETPDNFQFAVKAPQFITHILRLKECEEPLANFFASGLLRLGEKLGPILWQFPPSVTLKDDRFERFLEMLPKDSKDASALAKLHGPKVEGREWTEAEGSFPVRHAFEFRHPSFATSDFKKVLEQHNVAFVCAHAAGKAPYVEEPTADFVYVRLHGEGPRYAKGYPPKALADWAARLQKWKKTKRDVFTYFSNDAKVHSPTGAQRLLSLLSNSRKKKAA